MDSRSRHLKGLGSIPRFVGMLMILLFLNSSPSIAETTNKRMILPGATAQAVGGAFTAVADDASAGYYNPAGLGYLKGPGVSATVNNYSRSSKKVSGVTEDSNLVENSSALFPGFAGGHSTLGPFSYGWSYFTLEHQGTDESQTIKVEASELGSAFTYDRAQLTSGNLIHAGGSLALSFGQHVSLGVSEYYYRRQKQTSLKERSTFASGVFYDSHVRQSTANEGTLTVVGGLIKIGAFSLGVAGKIPKALSDKTEFETSAVTYTSQSPELGKNNYITHREDELIVRTLSVGMAWQPSSGLRISVDGIHYPATKTPWENDGGFDTKAVNDWSAGIELNSESLVLAGGAFTNSSLVKTPRPSLVEAEPTRIDYKGFSTGLGFKSKQSETMFIMVRQAGEGKTQMVQGDLKLQDVSHEVQSFSISSRYEF